MFQNFVANSHHYSNQSNQEAYIQAMYRSQYESHHEPSMRSSPSWTSSAGCSGLDEPGHVPSAHSYATQSQRSLNLQHPSSSAGMSTANCSMGSPAASGSNAGCGSRAGPTPDSYFRNAAAINSINGLHPYSYAAEAAAAAAAACAWAGRLDHASSGLSSSLPGSGSGFAGLGSPGAFRHRPGKRSGTLRDAGA